MKEKVGLVELTTYHEECLHSQALFLKDAGYDVHLFIHPKLVNQIADYKALFTEIITIEATSKTFFLKRVLRFLKLHKIIRQNKFLFLIFNTASSKKEVIGLTFLLKNKVKCVGVIHNLKKVNSSLSQKLINRYIKKYFVINDYLLKSTEIDDKTLSFESFYPIFFPNYKTVDLIKPQNELWITIPGGLDFNRRDYITIAKGISKNTNIKIHILGKIDRKNEDTIAFLQYLELNNIDAKFHFFDEFIPNNLFHSYLKKSDYILAPVLIKNESYTKYKITGAYNLAFAYKAPLICPKPLEVIPDLKNHSFFYEDADSLSRLIDRLSNENESKKVFYQGPKWSFKNQQNKYIKFLKSK